MKPIVATLCVSIVIADANESFTDLWQYFSSGWLPRPYPVTTVLIGSTLNLYQHSSAENIHTSGTRPIGGSWGSRSPFRGNEDDIKKSWSNRNTNGSFPSDGLTNPIILCLQWQTAYLPCIVRVDIGYDMSREQLYWLDTSRQYLSLQGMPTPFREVSVLFNNEHFITGRVNLLLPIYGAFVSTAVSLDSARGMTFDRINSFYYAGAYLSGSTLIVSEATQYVQIADAKNQIRYANGQDTVTLIDKQPLSTANPVRTGIGILVGWQFGFGNFVFTLDAYAEFPLTSVLRDARWMLYRYGFRTALGFVL